MPIPLQPTFLDISPTFVVPLMLSSLIMSSLVTPLIHLNILISAPHPTSSLVLSSLPMSRLHTSLLVLQPSCILILTLKLILRSHKIPDTLFQSYRHLKYITVIFPKNKYLFLYQKSKPSPNYTKWIDSECNHNSYVCECYSADTWSDVMERQKIQYKESMGLCLEIIFIRHANK